MKKYLHYLNRLKSVQEFSELVSTIKQGDYYSFELLFRKLYPKLCAFANRFLNNVDDAEDAVQEVFLNVWKGRDHLDETKSIESYLFTAIKNNCLNVLSKQKHGDSYAEVMAYVYLRPNDSANAHDYLVLQDIEKDFAEAVDQLPTECRKIFELSYSEGLKYREIAEVLNLSIKTVETQMSRAFFKIRLRLKPHLGVLLVATLFY